MLYMHYVMHKLPILYMYMQTSKKQLHKHMQQKHS